ncbi:hypothetical protein GCM10022215_18210 [Nocardioides fonticola]|uniref:Uracil-DNA glycosylase n=1 Tax=Nocardioides fonticola TaxID=450363 RepID=A0ABP7XKB3_9ACTN
MNDHTTDHAAAAPERPMTREEALAVLGVLGRAGSPLPVIPWQHVNGSRAALRVLARNALKAAGPTSTYAGATLYRLVIKAATVLGIADDLPHPAGVAEILNDTSDAAAVPDLRDTKPVARPRTYVFAPDRARALAVCDLYGVPFGARATLVVYPRVVNRIRGYSIKPTDRIVWAPPWSGLDDLPSDFRAALAPAFVTLDVWAFERLTNGARR